MAPKNKSNAVLSIADSINVIAALIGIFGFLTGISSLPLILLTKNGSQTDTTWFFSTISYSVAIPIFILTLVFVYGLYFVVVFKANRWLYQQNIIKRFEPPGLKRRDIPNYGVIYGGKPGDELSLVFFVSLGSVVGWLIVRAFLGISLDDLINVFDSSNPLYMTKDNAIAMNVALSLLAIMIIIGLVSWICVAAKNSASID